jgi:membrane AbrB-like protein
MAKATDPAGSVAFFFAAPGALPAWSLFALPANRWGRWFALIVLSLLLTGLLEFLRAPAALLLGPMVAAIFFGLRGDTLPMPRQTLTLTQAVVGCLVAQAFSPELLRSLARDGLPMLATVLTTVIAAGIVGLIMVKARTLPGTTAAWGSSPGGAAVMVTLAEEYGADVQLVAFMQYLRVVVVVLVASLVSWWLIGAAPAREVASTPALPFRVAALSLLATLGVAGIGAWLGSVSRIPGGALLVPMFLAVAVQFSGVVRIHLPSPLLALSFAALGWYVGLRFDRAALLHALAALPQLLLGIVLLIALCALSAWLLAALLHTDFLTAYLATAPGGLESVAIIAVDSGADVSLVMAMQALRLFVVVVTGPLIARWISRYA